MLITVENNIVKMMAKLSQNFGFKNLPFLLFKFFPMVFYYPPLEFFKYIGCLLENKKAWKTTGNNPVLFSMPSMIQSHETKYLPQF